MNDIEFDTDKNYSLNAYTSQGVTRDPVMIRFLMKLGVPDATLAGYILIGIIVIFFGITIFLYAGVFKGDSGDTVSIPPGMMLE